MPAEPTDFIDGLTTMAGNGDPHAQAGTACHVYAANRSMTNRAFYNADGELLIVPQHGRQRFVTELGVLEAEPQEIVVIPRGVRFRVELLDDSARGYVCENYGAPFRLPDLGPIGSNGLANPRDFLAPVAAYEDVDGDFELVDKFMGNLWRAHAWTTRRSTWSPGTATTRRTSTTCGASTPSARSATTTPIRRSSWCCTRRATRRGSAPSTSWSSPPRMLAMRDTFRPPWFHRNLVSEFMGLVNGAYDAKAEGFLPGGASLHNSMSGHGPDAETFEKASAADLAKPDVIDNTMAFMFETRQVLRPDAPTRSRPAELPARVLALLARLAEALQPGSAMTAYPSTRRTPRICKAGSRRPTTRQTDFPIQNLPFGRFRPRRRAGQWRIGVAIGDQVLDLAARRARRPPTT